MRSIGGIALILCGLSASACGPGAGDADNRSPTKQSDVAPHDPNTDQSSATFEPGKKANFIQIGNLFKDKSDFTPADLRNGFIACAALEDLAPDLEPAITWSPMMRSYLANELKKFPDHDLLFSSVSGIYLTSAANLEYKKGKRKGRVGGITCQNSASKKSIIFLNNEEFVSQPKMTIKVGSWYETANLVHSSVLENHGDQTLYTLIHELFHAIDLVHFVSGSDPKRKLDRQKITNLSWNSLTDSRFGSGGGMALTGPPTEISPETLKKHFSFSIHESTDLALTIAEVANNSKTPPTADEILAAAKKQTDYYTNLAMKTNFLTPYSAANAIEDFADTLAAYYFGTRYDSWMVRKVFDHDLSITPISQAALLHTFETSLIVRTSPAQNEKVCLMARLIFAESCSDYLAGPKKLR